MGKKPAYASDVQLNKLLHSVVNEVRKYAEAQQGHIRRLAQIGIALSAEKDINKLLEMIVDEAMSFTHADAGTLYTVDEAAHCLRFEILKNNTFKTHLGGTSGAKVDLPPVPLEIDGKPNFSNVSSHVALTGELVNIADVYKARGYDFTGPKKYDARTGYRSQSMLVIPMRDHENQIIGVLQLLNAKNPDSGEVIRFDPEYEFPITSLASQAAIALENARLIHELKNLFDAFIESIAAAIDEKSKYTAGHIRRVKDLTMRIAEAVNNDREGKFADVELTDDQMEELRIAAWLHDIGKIATPEYVVDKSRKLETIFDRIELLSTRFELIRAEMEKEHLQRRIEWLEGGKGQPEDFDRREQAHRKALAELAAQRDFVVECNLGRQPLTDEDAERLQKLAQKTYQVGGKQYPYLTADELLNLSIRRGTLTDRERRIIENHVSVSIQMLKKLPFPRKLAGVPQYAGGHHEKLNGSGYPYGLRGEQLPLQARIMAIADIFEALTARDRPYKEPMKLSRAIEILHGMCDRNEIDRDICDLFERSGIIEEYARRELNPEQIDLEGMEKPG